MSASGTKWPNVQILQGSYELEVYINFAPIKNGQKEATSSPYSVYILNQSQNSDYLSV